jgi:hypothetical protein
LPAAWKATWAIRRVKALALALERALFHRPHPARLAEIDIAGQFPDNENVQPRDDFGFERRCIGQLRIENGRAQVGKQAQCLAQPQNGLLGTQGALERIIFPVAHGSEQHCIGSLGQIQR